MARIPSRDILLYNNSKALDVRLRQLSLQPPSWTRNPVDSAKRPTLFLPTPSLLNSPASANALLATTAKLCSPTMLKTAQNRDASTPIVRRLLVGFVLEPYRLSLDLAARLGPDLVREMEVHIRPGAYMPSFAIRKDLQERYSVDRRHLYDYFHSRGSQSPSRCSMNSTSS